MKNKELISVNQVIEKRIDQYEKFVHKSIKEPTQRRGEAFQLYVVKVIKNIDHSQIQDEKRIDKSGREYLIDYLFNNKDFSIIDILCIQTGGYNEKSLSDLDIGINKLLLEHKELSNPKLEKKRKIFWKNKSNIEIINIFCCSIHYSIKIKEHLDEMELFLSNKIKTHYPKAKITIFLLGSVQLLTYEKKLLSKEIGKFKLSLKNGESSLIQNIFEDDDIKSVSIALIKTKDLLKIYKEKRDLIFYLNIRKDLGLNQVSKSISKDMSSDYRDYFWCLNNGLTIVCDKFDREVNSSEYSIINPVVINGQQTLRTLSKEKINNTHYILCKIVVTSNIEFIEKITETTNSQTEIKQQDLKSNHPLLMALEELFKINDLIFKRKKEKRAGSQLLTYNSKRVAQSVMSILMHQPNIGRLGKDKILFDKYFEDIFSKDYKKIILSVLICDNVDKCVKLIAQENKSEISKFAWHIACRIWEKEIKKNSNPNFDKLIIKYKEMVLTPPIIKEEYESLYKMIPEDIKQNKQIGPYLNSDKSLKII